MTASLMVACAVCMQAQSGAAVGGLRAAVLTLVIVTVAVLAGFGRFVIRVARRQ
jgi:hypothetical protein